LIFSGRNNLGGQLIKGNFFRFTRFHGDNGLYASGKFLCLVSFSIQRSIIIYPSITIVIEQCIE